MHIENTNSTGAIYSKCVQTLFHLLENHGQYVYIYILYTHNTQQLNHRSTDPETIPGHLRGFKAACGTAFGFDAKGLRSSD